MNANCATSELIFHGMPNRLTRTLDHLKKVKMLHHYHYYCITNIIIKSLTQELTKWLGYHNNFTPEYWFWLAAKPNQLNFTLDLII